MSRVLEYNRQTESSPAVYAASLVVGEPTYREYVKAGMSLTQVAKSAEEGPV
jgi:hypothetical protein